ncbi:MAG TPA: type II secretion system minor pseudopilin GspK [Burkholderiales bacterium]|nr:type II secretion system minor pseudopilin GspK [Burkholderiales bacterium]
MKPARLVQRGVAVVLAMGTVALATMAAVAILASQASWARRTELTASHAQALALAQAAVDWARAVLSDDRRASNVDHLGEPWAVRLAPVPIEEGAVKGSLSGYLEDQQGRFNLNNLAANCKVDSAQLAHFRRLLAVLGFSSADGARLADALCDWLDADGEPRPNGAEDDYYRAMEPPYLAANRPLTDLGELALVRGFDAGARARLRPFVSSLPRATPVNVNTAPPEVLAAVVDGLDLEAARILVTQRERVYFRDGNEFTRALPRGASAAAGDVSVASDYFSVTVHVDIGDAEASGTALLARPTAGWPTVVWEKMR